MPYRPMILEPAEVVERVDDGLHVLTVCGGATEWPELWELRGGMKALVGYTSMAALHAACGAGQPRRFIPAELVEQVCSASGATVAVIDEPLPEPPRYPEPDVRTEPDLEPLPEDDETPEVLYVPSRPRQSRDPVAELELQPVRGRRTLLVYDSLPALYEGCGRYQWCVAIRPELIDEVMVDVGAEQVMLNSVLSEECRHQEPVVDWRRRDTMGGRR